MNMANVTNNPYKVLGITPYMSEKEAKAQYRSLSKKYHPDNMETGDGEKFREINKAWKELSEYGSSAFGKVRKAWTHKTLFSVKRR